MKKQVLALVGACAFGFTATAADWFDAKINTYTEWPTNNATEFGGTWTNTAAATLGDNELKVSTDAASPLMFEATDGKALVNDTVTIASTLTFTAFDALPDVPAEAKAGVISCGGYFYILAKGDGDTNVWTKTEIEATETANVTVTFTDGSTATYQIGASTTNVTIKSITTVQNVCMSGDGAIAKLSATTEAKSVGPTPASGSETAVEKIADNTYSVKPTGEGTTVMVDNVKSGDTLVINGGDVDTLGVNSTEGVTIKVMNAEGKIDITKAVKGLKDNTFDATLDTNKTVEVQVGEATVNVPVVPTLVEETEAAKPFVVDTDVSTTVQSIPGLTYKLRRDQAPDGTYTTEADSQTAEENKATLTLKDANKPDGKAFYIIEVTK